MQAFECLVSVPLSVQLTKSNSSLHKPTAVFKHKTESPQCPFNLKTELTCITSTVRNKCCWRQPLIMKQNFDIILDDFEVFWYINETISRFCDFKGCILFPVCWKEETQTRNEEREREMVLTGSKSPLLEPKPGRCGRMVWVLTTVPPGHLKWNNFYQLTKCSSCRFSCVCFIF